MVEGDGGGGTVRPVAVPWRRHLAQWLPIVAIALCAGTLALPRPLGPVAILYAACVALNVLYIATTAWSTILGAALGVARRFGVADPGLVFRPPTGRARTAILLPVHEEDANRVFAAAAAMAGSLAPERIGVADFFILSDTRSATGLAAEESAAARLAALHPSRAARIFYRRRADTRGRKAGNIADFVARWGAAYDFAVTLDADSLMTGEAIARLVGAMEANPGAGLIQAMCYPIGRSTIFARVQQFSARLYSPPFQRGVSFWQGPRGNYWGHNAILRLSAFAASCGLPTLPGRPPLGGEIMSHDTVEAALLLRAGWDVWMLPDGPGHRHDGSWEETPTNALDHLDRDRRWCVGNLQHRAVLRTTGLQPASLYHLSRGLMHYLYVVPFLGWLLLDATWARHPWSGADAALVILVATLLFLPRALCLAEALAEDAAGFGGRAGLVVSTLLDQLLGLFTYPVALVFHTLFLGSALLGRTLQWGGQLRDDRSLGWGDAARILAGPTLAALLLLAAIAPRAPVPAACLAPGLILAIPLVVWSSRRDFGLRACALGLFATPDETRPPALCRAAAEIEAKLAKADLTEADLAGAPAAATIAPLPPEAGLAMIPQVLRAAKPRWRPGSVAPPLR